MDKIKVLTGVDIVEIKRIEEAVNRSSIFLENNFTKDEVEGQGIPSIAGKFAAKEAIIKALGDTLQIKMKDIIISSNKTGKPTFILNNVKIRLLSFDLSIAHSTDNAIASVVILL